MSEAGAPRTESDARLKQLMALHPKRIDLSLDRLTRLLDRLGNPEKSLPPTTHVAGTNGKGSCCAYLRAGFEAAGDRVHVYTSPHLVRFHERVRLAGALIDEAALVDRLRRCEEANAGAPITYFEITTAAAFLAFAETPADRLVLEVGLGGRLDATNVIDAPEMTVITPVSMDHSEFLGNDVATIAAEKAGILKRGAPCVVAAQEDDALRAIERAAAQVRAPLKVSGAEWRAWPEAGRLAFEDDDGLLDLPPPSLPGRHQFENAGAAIAAMRSLGLPEAAIARAVVEAEWLGRLQRLKRGSAAAAAGPDVEVWVDGGHNAAAGRALAEHMAGLEERSPAPLRLVVGMLRSKDPTGFLEPFVGLAERAWTVTIPDEPASFAADELADAASAARLPASAASSVAAAIRAAAEGAPARVLICGSLYLAGQVLSENE